jgi:hypothetical protein
LDSAKSLDRSKQVEVQSHVAKSSRIAAMASAIGNYSLGSARCFTTGNGGETTLYQLPPAVTSSVNGWEWVVFYDTVADASSGSWSVHGEAWDGPYWTRTDYPNWYYHNGQWGYGTDAGTAKFPLPIIGDQVAWLGVQWVHWYSGGGTVYQYTDTSQEDNGLTINSDYCDVV